MRSHSLQPYSPLLRRWHRSRKRKCWSYRLFDGDLRGTFTALDEATGELLGVGSGGPEAALSLEDMAPFLVRWYSQRAVERLGQSTGSTLHKLVRRYAEKPFTLRSIRDEILKTRNNAITRRFIEELLRYGYITEHPERLHSGGRPATQYAVAGAARLASAFVPAASSTRRR